MSDISDIVDSKILMTYLRKLDKKVSQIQYDLNCLKDGSAQAEPPLSSCSWGFFSGTTEDQLDLDDKNFDKAWFMKHYRVDCPEFDQPLTLKAFQEIGYEMTPEQYGKYISEFYKKEEEPKTLDKAINDIHSAKAEEL